ncbi:Sulfite efflux pump SSU1 [Cyphellophora attinorum]|uniref:Sulfite efflux pump SSU1 n=1 Tax=Cyphellophora attinorum TaxID=1664694 RepID=A0A0N1P4P8_9EURO|nr:Sulfite efflux pump SSU1 [Phialophora attinorum]KPI46073.1 Sulfite efflux pump SSU1 [Phialophora attinorum]
MATDKNHQDRANNHLDVEHDAVFLQKVNGGTGPATSPSQPTDVPERGFRRTVHNFTPSWFIITMSTGICAILLKQMPPPYDADWLRILADVFFVFNISLFLLFSVITVIRYIWYPHIWHRVVRHPHQSLFLACFPVGLATIINMIALVCAPAWGQGWAVFAWVLWWIVLVLALGTCFHLTFTIMTHRRHDLGEMSALYLIPIVAVVIVATSGSLVATAIPGRENKLWTLYISYILWGLGSPLSWIILTLYFLRLATYTPLKREVIVSLLLPIGPLGLEGFSLITLSKVAQELFLEVHAFPHSSPEAGSIITSVSILLGLLFWGFALVWFVIAVMMLAVSGGFPFNMGWWGFIFPVGVFTLLTGALGTSLESKFMKILTCILTAICIVMWLVVAAGTIYRSFTMEMFYSPCLGTNLYAKGRAGAAERQAEGKSTGAAKNGADEEAINPSETTMVAQDSEEAKLR